MQTQRLAKGPGPWVESGRTLGGGRDAMRLVQGGPSNLDNSCKDALHKLLKPTNYGAIAPWIQEARTQEKRDMVKLGEIAASGGNGITHPISWLPEHQERTVMNDAGRQRLAKSIPVTADRIQHDLHKNKCGGDAKDMHLEKRRQWFKNQDQVPNVNSMGDFFHLKDNPVYHNEVSQVLTESAKRALARWQVDGPEKGAGTSANVMRSLRSITDAVARIPRYNDHVRNQPSGPHGRKDILYDYSYARPHGGGTLLNAPYSIPDKQLHHSTSAPATLRPLIDPEAVDKVTRPGGYVVNLMDREQLAALKNRQRNKSTKIAMGGGCANYTTTAKAIGGVFDRS